MNWIIKRFRVPASPVFTLDLPPAATVLSVGTNMVDPAGIATGQDNPYVSILLDEDEPKDYEFTFVLLEENRAVDPDDVTLVRNGELVFIGQFKLATKTFYLFEDTRE